MREEPEEETEDTQQETEAEAHVFLRDCFSSSDTHFNPDTEEESNSLPEQSLL